MISLIFDTETTGLPNKELPPDHPNQARVMQIAMVLMDDDKEIGCFYSRLQPDNWPPIHPKAFEAHGLTEEMCKDTGLDAALVIKMYASLVDVADNVVAHNSIFDRKFIEIEGSRTMLGVAEKPSFCTMLLMHPITQLRRATGQAKWPNLTEALQHCYGPEAKIDKVHDALGDVRATAKVWRWLVTNNKVNVNS